MKLKNLFNKENKITNRERYITNDIGLEIGYDKDNNIKSIGISCNRTQYSYKNGIITWDAEGGTNGYHLDKVPIYFIEKIKILIPAEIFNKIKFSWKNRTVKEINEYERL